MVTANLRLKVVPGASRTQLAGWLGDALKVRVAAPPEAGKANRAVVNLLSESLELPAGAINITSGHGSQHKRVQIDGLTLDEVRRRLPK